MSEIDEFKLYDGVVPDIRKTTTPPKLNIFQKIIKNIFPKTVDYIETKTPKGLFKIYYDYKLDTLIVDIPNGLKLRLLGSLNIQTTDDFNVETLGEMNLLTHDNFICLDALNSNIHLNSCMAGQIRELTAIEEFRKEKHKQIKKHKEKTKDNKCAHQELLEIIGELVNRLNTLEAQVYQQPIDGKSIIERVKRMANHE